MNDGVTDAQAHLLAEASNGDLTPLRAQLLSRSWKRTMAHLEALGLVTFQPYAKPDGRYRVTPEGAAMVKALVVAGRLTIDT